MITDLRWILYTQQVSLWVSIAAEKPAEKETKRSLTSQIVVTGPAGGSEADEQNCTEGSFVQITSDVQN